MSRGSYPHHRQLICSISVPGASLGHTEIMMLREKSGLDDVIVNPN